VNLGDTFDTHSVVRSEVMTEFMQHVRRVLDLKVPYIYVLGNHDQYRPADSKYHALKHVKDTIPNFHVIDELTELHGITFVPYIHEASKFPTSTSSVCVAHQTFVGADYGDIITKDGVDPDSVSADIIISGHIHKRQILGKVIYPGSPFAQSVSDVNQIKGLMLFDSDTFKTTFIQTPMPNWRGLKYELTPSFDVEQMHASLFTELNNTDHWVLDVTGPKAEIEHYFSSSRWQDLAEGKDIKRRTNFTDKEKKQIRLEARSMQSIISDYFDKVYSGTLDKKILTKTAVDLLNELN
jgi:DNA repair exonuclease SbcCD nuclease subunit